MVMVNMVNVFGSLLKSKKCLVTKQVISQQFSNVFVLVFVITKYFTVKLVTMYLGRHLYIYPHHQEEIKIV